MLFLELAPRAKVVSFDIGGPTKPWIGRQKARLQAAYGDRFSLVLGDSAVEVPKRRKAQAGDEACDVVFIDGAKTTEGRLADLRNFRLSSRPNALLFLDEATSQRCVNGSATWDECTGAKWVQRNGHGYAAAVKAYNEFARSGEMRVLQCTWADLTGRKHVPTIKALKEDGLCAAEFVRL